MAILWGWGFLMSLSIPLHHLRRLRGASFKAHRRVYHSRVIKKKREEASLMEGGAQPYIRALLGTAAQCLKNTPAASSGSVQGGRGGHKPEPPNEMRAEVRAPSQGVCERSRLTSSSALVVKSALIRVRKIVSS